MTGCSWPHKTAFLFEPFLNHVPTIYDTNKLCFLHSPLKFRCRALQVDWLVDVLHGDKREAWSGVTNRRRMLTCDRANGLRSTSLLIRQTTLKFSRHDFTSIPHQFPHTNLCKLYRSNPDQFVIYSAWFPDQYSAQYIVKLTFFNRKTKQCPQWSNFQSATHAFPHGVPHVRCDASQLHTRHTFTSYVQWGPTGRTTARTSKTPSDVLHLKLSILAKILQSLCATSKTMTCVTDLAKGERRKRDGCVSQTKVSSICGKFGGRLWAPQNWRHK